MPLVALPCLLDNMAESDKLDSAAKESIALMHQIHQVPQTGGITSQCAKYTMSSVNVLKC